MALLLVADVCRKKRDTPNWHLLFLVPLQQFPPKTLGDKKKAREFIAQTLWYLLLNLGVVCGGEIKKGL